MSTEQTESVGRVSVPEAKRDLPADREPEEIEASGRESTSPPERETTPPPEAPVAASALVAPALVAPAQDDAAVLAVSPPGPEHGPERTANSLPPVGITVPPAALGSDPNDDLASNALLAARRRPQTRLVVASLVACSIILLIAAVRTARRGANPPSSASSLSAIEPSSPPPAPPQSLPVQNAAPAATNDAPVVWSNTFPGTEVAAPPAAPSPTTGTLRLRWPAMPGYVWLDGAKVKEASSLVRCGAHEIRVGVHGHPRPIDVPCGGELPITQ